MSYGRFVGALRRILIDLGMEGQTAAKRTFYSLRRELPTGADILSLEDNDAYAIGNWQEIPKGINSQRPRAQPIMPKHYAGNKVTTGGFAKTKVIAAIMKTHELLGDTFDWEDVRSQHFQGDVLVAMAAELSPPGMADEVTVDPSTHRTSVVDTDGPVCELPTARDESSEEEECPDDRSPCWFIQGQGKKAMVHLTRE